MEQLSPQIKYALTRFPSAELSYETISHTKVYTNYDIGVAVPHGKKGYMWFTFDRYHDVSYLFEINREKKIVRGNKIEVDFDKSLSVGTLLYGTIISDEGTNAFLIEDILQYRGISLDTARQLDKLSLLYKLFNQLKPIKSTHLQIYLPAMWQVKLTDTDNAYPSVLPQHLCDNLPYTVRHIQYRSSLDKMPFINVFISRNGGVVSLPVQPAIVQKPIFDFVPIRISFTKPQYRYATVFSVTADIQYDIYHLYACGKNNQRVYYNVANVPNYATSVFLNGLFRKIRENSNLDYIEESEDEDDFQNMEEDKYVDMNKTILLECVFDRKFKKWTPMRVMDRRTKIVHISQL
jgi:hypothetical protein